MIKYRPKILRAPTSLLGELPDLSAVALAKVEGLRGSRIRVTRSNLQRTHTRHTAQRQQSKFQFNRESDEGTGIEVEARGGLSNFV
jgi:hypothetical protein